MDRQKTLVGKDIQLALDLLKKNELVAIPTETVYGLAANALSPEAVVKIFEVKQRPFFDPLIVHVHSVEEIQKYVTYVPMAVYELAKYFSAITYVLPKQDIIPDIVTSGHNTVGIRIPGHPLTLELLKKLDFPLAAPSANPFGYVSPTTAQHVLDSLGGKIPYILDGGTCKIGVESTIISFETEIPTILRLGGTTVETIEEIIGKVDVNIQSKNNPDAPGMLETHYAPHVPLYLEKCPPEYSYDEIGVIAFERYHERVPIHQQFVLSPTGDLSEAARNLFHALRSLDNMPIKAIVAEIFPEKGLGKAINDRLRRASVKRLRK
ncbi:MAG: L-threonylcarbamoyladenylate synthase [Bacteroidia bacterium]|nr:L-threonylcarbamoyladenylate synthase [Bacteroidia bacterium]MDW8301678.1 L-threonylcarbamoyladenylate synthase [Bacteroidia bacterium]